MRPAFTPATNSAAAAADTKQAVANAAVMPTARSAADNKLLVPTLSASYNEYDIEKDLLFADATAEEKRSLQTALRTKTLLQAVSEKADHFQSESKKVDAPIKHVKEQFEQLYAAHRAIIAARDFDEKEERQQRLEREPIVKENWRLIHTQSEFYAQEFFWRTKQLILLTQLKLNIDDEQQVENHKQALIAIKNRARLHQYANHRLAHGLLYHTISAHTLIVNNQQIDFEEKYSINYVASISSHEVIVCLVFDIEFLVSYNRRAAKLVIVNLNAIDDDRLIYLEGNTSEFRSNITIAYLGDQSLALSASAWRHIEIVTWSGKKVTQLRSFISEQTDRMWSVHGFLLAKYWLSDDLFLWNPYTGELLEHAKTDLKIFEVLSNGSIIMRDDADNFHLIAPFKDYFAAANTLRKDLEAQANSIKCLPNDALEIVTDYLMTDSSFVNETVAIAKGRNRALAAKPHVYYGQLDYKDSKDIQVFLTGTTQVEKQIIDKALIAKNTLYQAVSVQAQHHQQFAEDTKDVDQKQLHLVHERFWRQKQVELLVHAKDVMPTDYNLEIAIDQIIAECLQRISYKLLQDSNIFYLRLSNGQVLSFSYPHVRPNNSFFRIDNRYLLLPDMFSTYHIIGATEANGNILLRLGKLLKDEYVSCLLTLFNFSKKRLTVLGNLPNVKASADLRDRIQNDMAYLGDQRVAIRIPDEKNALKWVYAYSWKFEYMQSMGRYDYDNTILRIEGMQRDPANPEHRLLMVVVEDTFYIWDHNSKELCKEYGCQFFYPKVILSNYSAIVCELSVRNGYAVLITRPTLTFKNALIKPNSGPVEHFSKPLELEIYTAESFRLELDVKDIGFYRPTLQALPAIDVNVNASGHDIKVSADEAAIFADLTPEENQQLQITLKTKTLYEAVQERIEYFESKKNDAQLKQRGTIDAKAETVLKERQNQAQFGAQEKFWRIKQMMLLCLAKPQTNYSHDETTLSLLRRLKDECHFNHYDRLAHGLLVECSYGYMMVNNQKIDFDSQVAISPVSISPHKIIVRLAFNLQDHVYESKLAIVELKSTGIEKTYLDRNFPSFNMNNSLTYLGNQCLAVYSSVNFHNRIEIITWSGDKIQLTRTITIAYPVRKIWSQSGFLLTQSSYLSDCIISLWNPYTGKCIKEIREDSPIFNVLFDGRIILDNFKVLDFRKDIAANAGAINAASSNGGNDAKDESSTAALLVANRTSPMFAIEANAVADQKSATAPVTNTKAAAPTPTARPA